MNIKRQKMLRLSLSYLVIFVMCAIIFYRYYGLLAHRLIRVIVYLDQVLFQKCNVRSLS